LFLDEPTTGLDPQSRLQTWGIVEELMARGRTALITTHYMEEAARLCHRVAIVDHGRLIALGTPRELVASLGAEHVIEFDLEPGGGSVEAEALRALPSVEGLAQEAGRYRLTVREVHRTVPALLAALAERRAAVSHLTTHHATLEDVFVAKTGRTLRDA
jgi:ABC-2 type transport system ATP-binding protein